MSDFDGFTATLGEGENNLLMQHLFSVGDISIDNSRLDAAFGPGSPLARLAPGPDWNRPRTTQLPFGSSRIIV